eukprot:m.83766 g.83766  ORF g.83766 m.83766 type:complete len:52 (-) comp13457_c0_seq1:43-198(-)
MSAWTLSSARWKEQSLTVYLPDHFLSSSPPITFPAAIHLENRGKRSSTKSV